MKADRNKDLAVPEFGPPRGVFYQQPDGEGKLSTYGDQALAILEHIVAHSGVDLDKLADSHASRFGAGSAYDIEGKLGHAVRLLQLLWLGRFGSRLQSSAFGSEPA